MRKLPLLLLAAAFLAAAVATADRASTAATASQTVTITHTGYKPTSVSIAVGDAVAFSNGDTVAHTVDFKSTTGMHCGVALPLVLQAGQSASCTFSSTGKFNFSDPANKGKGFHGTVTVGTALVSSITVSPKAVVYGRKTTLAGTSPTNVSISCGPSPRCLSRNDRRSCSSTGWGSRLRRRQSSSGSRPRRSAGGCIARDWSCGVR